LLEYFILNCVYLQGKKSMIVAGAKYVDSTADFLCGLCIFLLVVGLPFVHRRDDGLLLAVSTLRTLVAILFIWCLMIHLQILPVVGHAVIFIREMATDLFAFSILSAVFNAVFTRQFILFFSHNSNKGCLEVHGNYRTTSNYFGMFAFCRYAVISLIIFITNISGRH